MGFENFALNCEMQPNRVPGFKNNQPLTFFVNQPMAISQLNLIKIDLIRIAMNQPQIR